MIGRHLPIRRLLSANGRPIPNRGPPNVWPGIRGPSMLAMMSTPERERSPTSATDKMAALALTPVSRQIEARLDAYVDLLVQWQTKTNLVASSTLPELWTRHIADSLQLLKLAPNAKRWADFGSGGGFPG